ncbi:hypothetical protein Pst134EA_013762 [Puccinia striiformis f. sp. tritici]|uniref:hypothetical protein n=1 Tax=Puccinia striiformis f. sp. tritici TaxID=168172 RepID=UPI0020087CF4|nr:hypothetical protein Pst134EA_013762 [Puccinia striiformis f. sp. tritici]KAH9465906.1 hypothetical protein Pst134EA_013762 [Puccinia striiformis f. sp. tritici]
MQSISLWFLLIISLQIQFSHAIFHCDDRSRPDMKVHVCARKTIDSDSGHIAHATDSKYLLINARKTRDGWTCGGVDIFTHKTTDRFCCGGQEYPTPEVGDEETMKIICYAR